MPLQQALPAWVVLNASNDTAASGMSDVYTNFPYNAGGLNLGDYFDLTSQEAFRNCKPSVGQLFCGRYRRVQVDSGATAANIKTGTIGLMASQAAASIDIGNIGGKLPVSMNVVTDFSHGHLGATVIRPVVFLNAITPGNFGWVQELGVATVLGAASFTNGSAPAAGDLISTVGNNTGVVNDIAAQSSGSSVTYAQLLSMIGVAYDIPFTNGLFRVVLEGVPIVQD